MKKEQFNIQATEDNDDLTLSFIGTIGGDTEIYHPSVIPSAPNKITIDLSQLVDVTKDGIFTWMEWFSNIGKTTSISFTEFPYFLICKSNSTAGLFPKNAKIISFQLPYICHSCKQYENQIMFQAELPKQVTGQLSFPSRSCKTCNKTIHPIMSSPDKLSILHSAELSKYSLFNYIRNTAIVVIDDKKRIRFANDYTSKLFNISQKRLLNNNIIFYDLIKITDQSLFCTKDGEIGRKDSFGPLQTTLITANKNTISVHISIINDYCSDTNNPRWIVCLELLNNDSKHKEEIAIEKIKTLDKVLEDNDILPIITDIDEITGIYNLNRLIVTLNNEMLKAKASQDWLTVLSVDIDFFKKFEELFGDDQAYEIIKKVAMTILSVTRSADTIARTAGNKFTLILPSTDERGMHVIMEKIRNIVSSTPIERIVHKDGNPIHITISLGGTAISPKILEQMDIDKYDIKDIIERVNDNLREAKNCGKNRSVGHKFNYDNIE